MVSSPFRKSVSPSPRSRARNTDNDDETYFREFANKNDGGSLLGSNMSNNVDGDEILSDLDRSLGLLEDASLSTDVERAVAAAGAVSPPRLIGPASTSSGGTASLKDRRSSRMTKSSKSGRGQVFYNRKASRTSTSTSSRRSNTTDGKKPTDYAISYFRSNHDDGSISTLGEDSILRRLSPLNAEQLAKARAADKAQMQVESIFTTPEPIDLKKSRTRSTLEERPSNDVEENAVKADTIADSVSSMDDEASRRKWRIIYCIIAVALLLLLAAASVLTISFLQLKNQEQQDNSARENPRAPTWFPGDRETWTRSPTEAPIEETITPTDDPVNLAREDLMELIRAATPDSLSALGSPESPQFLAFDWMVNDPEYSTYPVDRILQRWSMAVLYFSTGGDMWEYQVDGNSTVEFNQWLDQDNECSWFSTNDGDVCDEEGRLIAIHLNDMGLFGTIPPELSLLSNSLERLYLWKNNITGTIPFEIGALSHLLRLQLTANNIEGTIPSEIARLTDLRVLGLGRNRMTGRLPEQLGSLGLLKTLGLEKNDFDGTIPVTFGGMTSLELLALQGNELNGIIPVELAMLDQLSTLSLHQNELEGSLPIELCPANATIEFLSADCIEVDCECCTHCCMECEGDQGSVTPVEFIDGRFDPDDDFNITDYNTTDFNTTDAPSDEWNATEPPRDIDATDANETATIEPSNATDITETLPPNNETDLEDVEQDDIPATNETDLEDVNDDVAVTQPPSIVEDVSTDEPTSTPTGLFDILRPIIIDQQANDTMTDEPSSTPVVPTPEPTECVSSISTTSTCFKRNEAGIEIAYSSCNPTANDWFGLIKKDSGEVLQVGDSAPNWNDSELWIRSCGDRQCSRRSFEGTVTLGDDKMKIADGEYQLILVRRLVVIATVETIFIEKNCDEGMRL